MKLSYYPVGDYQANCVFLSDEEHRAVAIDPGSEAPRLLQRIREQRLQVETILLTHVHFDHLLAVRELQEATGATLCVPAADEPALLDSNRSLIPASHQPYPLSADRLLHDGDTVTCGEMTLEVWHTPGHTPGSSCYRCGQLLIAGDTLFAGSVGRTDFPGGDAALLYQSLRRLASLPADTQVIPGHGESTTIGRELQYNPFLLGVTL